MSKITIIYECLRCGVEVVRTRSRRAYRTNLPLYCYDCIHGVRKDRARWSDIEVTRLRELWAKGEPKEAIASALGRSTVAINNKRMRLGLPARYNCRPNSEEEVAAVRYYLAKGHTYRETATLMHMSRSRLAGIVARHLNERSASFIRQRDGAAT